MACYLLHTVDEIKALVQKQIDEDIIRLEEIVDVTRLFDKARAAKEDMRKAYQECKDIPQEKRVVIDTFLEAKGGVVANVEYQRHVVLTVPGSLKTPNT
ncbi:hypothetical protein Tco_1361550 [Tanacetum coccineum]